MSDLRNSINRIVSNTKRNRAGNQQPYVPAGNGDESGEYADMVSGSNIHYTAPTPMPPTTERVKKTSRLGEIKSLKQKNAIYEHIRYKTDYNYSMESIIRDLRYYDGSFGDLSNFTDDELKDMIEQVKDIEANQGEESVYYLKGGKWYLTKNKEKLDLIGQKYYTKEEKEAYDKKKIDKQGKQSTIDGEINKIFGDNCLVNFGKGYDNEYLTQIRDYSAKIVNDFPELNGFVRGIGDRNSLMKYSQAIALQNLDENKVQEEALKIQERARSYGRDISLEEATKQAKTKLSQGFNLSRGGRSWLAYWSPSQKCLVMLPKSNEDISNIESRYISNWHSSNKLMGTYCHEFGHGIVSLCESMYNEKRARFGTIFNDTRTRELNEAWQEFNNAIGDKLRENQNVDFENEVIKRYNNSFGTNYDSIRTIERNGGEFAIYRIKQEVKRDGIRPYKLSQYGNTNRDELIAESFSAYYTDMNNEFANSIVDIVKNYYNKLRSL